MEYLLLEQINSPQELRKLDKQGLYNLSREIREFILNTVSQTGGHLASNLGSIELSLALHYVYNTPDDLLVWDVGHQSYTHKIITGRREQMTSLRQFGGLAGFPKRDESIYDTFGVGHSSTSISAALGMAVANKRNNNNKTVAIIGDGAMTAGLAFEGLNNAGWLDTDILVVLNDNEMSISENVGAMSRYLSHILSGRFYNTIKNTANKALNLVPPIQKFAHKVEEHIKGMVMPSTLFEEFGFNYIGPIDGHDIDELVTTLQKIKNLSGPQFLHVVTKKGQGYKLAENNPINYHGVTKFDPSQGMQGSKTKPTTLTYTQVFSQWLCDMAQIDNNFIAITPAMREGSGMVEFAKQYPERFFDVGIAEQHAITFAGGAATQGVKPVVAIYSTFLQRGYDQLIHDIALQNLPVMFAIDRAGIVGPDGPTHIGAFDISYLICIPNMIVMTPSDENECYQMLYTALRTNAPCAVRYPRGTGIGAAINAKEPVLLPIGKGNTLRFGKDIAILVFGTLLKNAKIAAEELNATLCDMRFAKPLDSELLKQIYTTHKIVVTIEENVIIGGAGSYCLQLAQQFGFQHNAATLNLGLPDNFIEHGDVNTLLAQCGLDSAGIVNSIKAFSEVALHA